MCRMLEVSRAGFYEWSTRPPSRRSLEDARLLPMIKTSLAASDSTYRAIRVARDLRDWGERCGKRRTGRLMRVASLRARPNSEMTAQLVTDALLMAIWRRGKPVELLHHSDQGSQYTAEDFQRLLADQGVTCSMSRRGDCWDNAVMESFFSTLKRERVYRRQYASRDQARADVFDYIERFYNPRRRRSTLDLVSPDQFEKLNQA
jgi:transposase InsO family protein